METPRAIRLTITGRVQGVGFRPTVFRLATSLGLAGTICNTTRGVVVELEGNDAVIERFRQLLPDEIPTLARIKGISAEKIAPTGRTRFEIVASQETAPGQGALVPYDVATCPACLNELRDPADRRHGYAFTNCTLCGPRYTIIESVPYDRPKTSMKAFPMCPDCQREYQDPTNRRYHAEPNACPDCGPRLTLVDNHGHPLPGDPLLECRKMIAQGRIAAVKGIGGFHLAADATLPQAVALLRKRKKRGAKPFAVMSPDLAAIQTYAQTDASEKALLVSDRRPIVLLDKLMPFVLAEEVAPANPRVGAMLPYSPLHHLLLEGFSALVLTSGNLAEEPIAKDNPEALVRLEGLADVFLLHDREILMSCDDSVAYQRLAGTALVRRSRGFAPDPVELPFRQDGILAVGAQMKNCLCLTRGNEAFLSQHVGDLENLETYQHFERCLRHMIQLLGIQPRVVACDQHPDYLSTQFAKELSGVELVSVQHHHAHLAACMADRGLMGEVIGLCLDGTGWGDDGTVWGGEVLVGSYQGYRRVGRLGLFPLPGGESAIREIWRCALGLLFCTVGPQEALRRVEAFACIHPSKAADVMEATKRNVCAPKTSSLGRLFDAVAALLSLRTEVDYDGQGAVDLESAAGNLTGDPWDMPLRSCDHLLEIELRPLVLGLLQGIDQGVSAARLAACFHASVVRAMVQICDRVRDGGGPNRVVLSGGCMMNRRLESALQAELGQKSFEVYVHQQVPANDGGICLGQAAVAAARMGMLDEREANGRNTCV